MRPGKAARWRWSLEVPDPGAGGAGPFRGRDERFHALPASAGHWPSLAGRHVTPVSGLVFRWPAACASVSMSPFLSREDTRHWIEGPPQPRAVSSQGPNVTREFPGDGAARQQALDIPGAGGWKSAIQAPAGRALLRPASCCLSTWRSPCPSLFREGHRKLCPKGLILTESPL